MLWFSYITGSIVDSFGTKLMFESVGACTCLEIARAVPRIDKCNLKYP